MMSNSVPGLQEDSRKAGTVVLKGRGLRWRHAGGRYGRAANGSVEYSVVLAMVCSLALVAAAVLGRTVCARMQNANCALSLDTRQPTSDTDTVGLNRTTERSLSVSAATLPDQYATIAICVLVLGSLFATACFLGWYSRRGRRQIAAADPSDISELQVKETENKLFAKRQELLGMLHSNDGFLAANEITVRHVMTSNPVTVLLGTSADEIRTLMEDNRWHHVLVCGTGLRLLGVISDRDVRGRSGRTAQHIMTAKPNFVSPDTPLGTAVTYLVARQISCLPVVDAGRVCGILTTTDLVLVAHAFLQMWLRLQQKGSPTVGGQDIEVIEDRGFQLAEFQGSPSGLAVCQL